jgi:hypothetical protein
MMKLLVSAFIAALLALFGAMVALAVPASERLIAERVCAPGEALVLRRQMVNVSLRRTFYECRGATGSRDVGMRPYGYAYLLSLLALTPLVFLIGSMGSSLAGRSRAGGTTKRQTRVRYVARIAESERPNLREVGELLTSLAQSGASQESASTDAAQALRQLEALRAEGLMTQEEYERKRAAVLARYFGGAA